jgi:hypothetical protein
MTEYGTAQQKQPCIDIVMQAHVIKIKNILGFEMKAIYGIAAVRTSSK